jgi:hypothetical protein
MANESLCLVTPRDRDLFQALDRCPLTVRQLLKLSATFAHPFTTERRVQERLQKLGAAGRVRRWRYATAGQGALSYYTLAPLGYRLLHGFDAQPSGRGLFSPIGVARQAHARALADVIVHLCMGAREASVSIENFRRENTVRLSVGDESLYPDGAFEIQPDPDSCFTFYIEIDNRTETVWPGNSLDSWGRKVQFYERYQDTREKRFRVLAITTGGPARLANMLQCATELSRNPRRSLVYAVALRDFLDREAPLTDPCFYNHLGQSVALLPHNALTATAVPLAGPQAAIIPFPSSPFRAVPENLTENVVNRGRDP